MIIGHERQIGYFDEARRRGHVAHAYIFYGPSSVGKYAVATAFAQSFFCVQVGVGIREVCGSCAECLRVTHGTHPFVRVLDGDARDEEDKAQEISIDAIRALRRECALAPGGGNARVVIANAADRMSEEASHAFLKILEEPPPRTYLVCVTTQKELLLQTILSRSQAIYFGEVVKEKIVLLLEKRGIAAGEREEIATLAGGRPGRAVALAGDNAARKELQSVTRKVRIALERRDVPEALEISERAAASSRIRAYAIEALWHAIRARMRSPAAYSIGRIMAVKRADAIMTSLEETNVNPRLGLDMLLLEAMRIFG